MRMGGRFTRPDEKPRVTWRLLKRVMLYAKPYRGLIGLMLLMTLASAGLSLITPLIMRYLIDHVLPDKNLTSLIWAICGLLAIPLLNGGLSVVQRQVNSRVGEGVVFNLRSALFSHLQRMSFRFFTHTMVGELMSRLNNDVVGAQNAISNTFVSIITNLIEVIAVLVVMFTLEWRLTLISIAVFPLFLLFARNLGNRLRQIARLQLEKNARMNAVMNELLNISGILLVKLFGQTEEEDKRFQTRAREVRDIGIRRAVMGSLFFTSIGLASAIGVALVYGIGGFMVIKETLTIGTIIAMGAYLGNLYSSLRELTNSPVDFATSMVSFERVFEVIDLPLEISEKSDALELQKVKGKLEFHDVNFRYRDSDEGLLKSVQRFGQMQNIQAVLSDGGSTAVKEIEDELPEAVEDQIERDPGGVLQNISFRAEPGNLIALVGPSGAGKTTLTYLIPRLYDPVSGHITIDGYNLKDVTLSSLAAQIGMVTQETYLFHDSIKVNLQYSKPGASQSEMEEAAKVANIHDFIMSLPDRYNTVVGERGYRLSGGEKQRIAIARVILKDPRILILDEATSSLDSQSEALIQEAMKRVMMGRTSIVIAHRLSTILNADLILVMDHGRIIERGTHAQLLETGGLYTRLYQTQFSRGL